MNGKKMLVAAAAYPIEKLLDWKSYATKIDIWLHQAAAAGAQLALFPEYLAMELVSLLPKRSHLSLSLQLSALQDILPDFIELFSQMAKRHALHIAAGTFPVVANGHTFRNRCHFFFPDGSFGFQDKLVMTRFESEQLGIDGGDALTIFPTDSGTLGICICYDIEFPHIARKLVEAGADVLLVPSCTDTTHGHHRVRVSCRARALENQCFVVQSATVGVAGWSEAVDVNIGSAAILTPIDDGFPQDGILTESLLNQGQWISSELALSSLAETRKNGQVRNFQDRNQQLHDFPLRVFGAEMDQKA
ncbi:MAG: carbon-nitrogen hydrolase family protein [Desulfobulbaceae bacterium]|nr:MAG: carbon-nitrogen hydrolase family protein [Desulfobulbaceae bacterium]